MRLQPSTQLHEVLDHKFERQAFARSGARLARDAILVLSVLADKRTQGELRHDMIPHTAFQCVPHS